MNTRPKMTARRGPAARGAVRAPVISGPDSAGARGVSPIPALHAPAPDAGPPCRAAGPEALNEALNVEALYEAIFDDDSFAALPARLARSAGARAAIIQWRHVDFSWEALAYSHHTPAFMNLYVNTYAAIDPWTHASLARANTGRFVSLDRHVSQAAFEESPFQKTFLAPLRDDTVHCASLALKTLCGDGVIRLTRGRRAGAFAPADLQALDVLAPHLTRLLRVRGELAAHRHGALVARDTLDTLGIATIVVRGDGRMVHANLVGEAILRRRDGLSLADGAVACADTGSEQRLTAAIGAATAANHPTGSAIAIERGPGQAPYLIDLTPMGGRFRRSMALLTFRDPAVADRSLGARLQSLFGLTRGEAAIAVDLSRGLSPCGIAPKRGVKPGTVKSQIASLAAKMGCARQSEIAALVAALPPSGV